jgi:uncharacterized surface protein with fasciclin (FAS1) repeats
MYMEDYKKYIVPVLIALLVLFFVFLYFVTRQSPTSPITLSVSPTMNVANVLSGAQNATGAGNGATTGTSGSRSGTGSTSSISPNDPLAGIKALPQASTFVSLLESTGVASQLSLSGTYTFFVPTNAAFAASALGPLANMTAEEKLRLAEYHIVSGKMMSVDLVKSGYMTTLSRDPLNANVFDIAQVGGNTHVVAIYPTRNGIIYLIDIVLQPPVRRPFPF